MSLIETETLLRVIVDRSVGDFPERVLPIEAYMLEGCADDIHAARLAFEQIRKRVRDEDTPLNVAADIEQIICETGNDWGV